MNRSAQQASVAGTSRVVRRISEEDRTPPADHEDFKRSQALGFESIRRIMDKRRKKRKPSK